MLLLHNIAPIPGQGKYSVKKKVKIVKKRVYPVVPEQYFQKSGKKTGKMAKNGVFHKKKAKNRDFSIKKLDKWHFTLYFI